MKVLVLPTQEDIANFHSGMRPGNVLEHEFQNEAELQAYKDGIDALEDEFDTINGLRIEGTTVYFHHALDEDDDVEDDDISEVVVTFATLAEAEAFRQGIEDAEGFHSPAIFEETEQDFVKLSALMDTASGEVNKPKSPSRPGM